MLLFLHKFYSAGVLGPVTDGITNLMDSTDSYLLSSSNAMVQCFSTEEAGSNIHGVFSTTCEEANSVEPKLGVTKEENIDEKSVSVLVFIFSIKISSVIMCGSHAVYFLVEIRTSSKHGKIMIFLELT